ncbi:sensor histidine kinase [Duganella radicis]|nr:HAMP domain-containing sensor histidine kinase [Duganella radicis]
MMLATDQKEDSEGLSATSRAMLSMRGQVFDLWEAQVRARVAEAIEVPGPLLTNTLPAFYDNIAEALTPAYPRADGASNTTSMSAHGRERARMTPFSADQIILEYQLFRDAIAVVALRNGIHFQPEEWAIVERSIDIGVREAVREFSLMHEGIRERLAATLSHDMRNPLSLVLTGTQLIAVAPDLDTARGAALKIRSGAQRLEHMLIQLVDALTFDRGVKLPLSLSEFNIRHLVTTLMEEFSVPGAGEIVAHVEPVTGFWCKNSLLRALENLLTNAFKYGDGGRVVIKGEQIRGRLMLSVHNTGKPIPGEQRERIFEYLRREENGNGHDGWGIGLPFVRSVAEGHGGSAAVDSSADAGTTFIIDIPIDCRPYVKNA